MGELALSAPSFYYHGAWHSVGAEMDHNEALRLQAAEKYVLGELPPPLRDEFEEHFFDCQECAQDVIAVAGFVDNARHVWRSAA